MKGSSAEIECKYATNVLVVASRHVNDQHNATRKTGNVQKENIMPLLYLALSFGTPVSSCHSILHSHEDAVIVAVLIVHAAAISV